MAHCTEVIVTTDTSNGLNTSSVWNPLTAVQLMGYKSGGVAESKTLNFVGNDYLVAAERSKPLLHVWFLNSQEPIRGVRFVTPGNTTALAVSNDGVYIIAGIDEKIYTWHALSGALLTIIKRHYQTICNIKFTPDDKFFVSSSLDGTVMVWSLTNVIGLPEYGLVTQNVAGQHDPVHLLCHHTQQVTDLCISKMGVVSRMATASLDRTCKIIDLTTGDVLLSVIFSTPLHSVTFDILELKVFVGGAIGNIYQFGLTNDYGTKELIYGSEVENKLFIGHEKPITCLSVSFQGRTLMSAAMDCTVRIWDIASRQQLSIITLKGIPTNAFFTMNKQNIYKSNMVPKIVLPELKRSQDDDDNMVMHVVSSENNFWQDYIEDETEVCLPENVPGANDGYQEELEALKMQINQLKKINNDMYQFAVLKATQFSRRH